MEESKGVKEYMYPMDFKELQKSHDLELHLKLIKSKSEVQDGELAGPASDPSIYKVLELLD